MLENIKSRSQSIFDMLFAHVTHILNFFVSGAYAVIEAGIYGHGLLAGAADHRCCTKLGGLCHCGLAAEHLHFFVKFAGRVVSGVEG